MAKQPTTAADKTKRTKFELDSTEEEMSTFDILALNDDCLIEVFSYLSSYELLNVIQTNTRFKLPCEHVFKRKFCGELTTVSNIGFSSLSGDEVERSESMCNLKHFGHLMSKLCIEFQAQNVGNLLEAIAANCDKNILELKFINLCTRFKAQSMSYKIGNKGLRTFMMNLPTKFTNLTSLSVDYSNRARPCPYATSIIQAIPSLKSFSMEETSSGTFLSEENLRKFIVVNRQLQHLSIVFEEHKLDSTDRSWHITRSFIRYLDETLPLLKSLEINRASLLTLPKVVPPPTEIFDFRTEDEPPVGQFANLKELTFGCFPEFYGIDLGFVLFRSDAVEELSLSNFDWNIHYFIMHVTQFKNLKILELEFPMELTRIMNANQLTNAVWRPNGIRELIVNNINLEKIVIRPHPSEYEGFIPGALATKSEYRGAINGKINGCWWLIHLDEFYLLFRKFVPK